MITDFSSSVLPISNVFNPFKSLTLLVVSVKLRQRRLSEIENWKWWNTKPLNCRRWNFVFIYFTVDEAKGHLGCGHEKAGKLFCELEKIDLIDRRKQGLGKPAIIYVKKFILDIRKSDVLNSGKPTSGNLIFSSQDIGKSDVNKTEKWKLKWKNIYYALVFSKK